MAGTPATPKCDGLAAFNAVGVCLWEFSLAVSSTAPDLCRLVKLFVPCSRPLEEQCFTKLRFGSGFAA